MEYRNVGDHTHELADGRSVPPGEYIELSEDDVRGPFAEELIANGQFLATEEQAQHEADLAERRTKARDKRAAADEGEEAK